jgi:hypothetical protein
MVKFSLERYFSYKYIITLFEGICQLFGKNFRKKAKFLFFAADVNVNMLAKPAKKSYNIRMEQRIKNRSIYV